MKTVICQKPGELIAVEQKQPKQAPGEALIRMQRLGICGTDLHAFGDSNAYLARRKKRIVLSVEHRSAKSMDPIELALVSQPNGSATHLEIAADTASDATTNLAERALLLIQNSKRPMTRTAIREHLKVNNQRLGDTLAQLDKQTRVHSTPKGGAPLTNHGPNALNIY